MSNPNNRIPVAAIMSPITTALIAFRLDAAREHHYNDVVVGVSIAWHVCQLVPSQRARMPDIEAGFHALNAIFTRHRDHPDVFWLAYPAECSAIEQASLACRDAIIASPPAAVRRAVQDVQSGRR